ncbi:hypothetical protein L7F22_009172 [Adiantum nelumboides]|nr:hypothetical protein [Adiantum nelumboides]
MGGFVNENDYIGKDEEDDIVCMQKRKLRLRLHQGLHFGQPMDILTGLHFVLEKVLAHDGLAKGLHEAAKAIEKQAAQLCVLAEDCNQPDYSKRVQAF